MGLRGGQRRLIMDGILCLMGFCVVGVMSHTYGQYQETKRTFRDVTGSSSPENAVTVRIESFLDVIRQIQQLQSLEEMQAQVGNIHTFVRDNLRQTSDFLEELATGPPSNIIHDQATSLVNAVETLGYLLGLDMQIGESRRLTIGGITFYVSTFRASNFKGLHFSQDGGDCAISIPYTASFPSADSDVIVVSYSVADVGTIMPRMANSSLGSDLLTTTFVDKDGTALSLTIADPVFLEMTVDMSEAEGKTPACTFLETSDDGKGSWSTSGCETVYPVENQAGKVHCHCDHLSTFGVILTDEVEEARIGVVAWVGCSLTILFCVLTALVFIGYRMMQSIRCYIRFSFLTALALAEMLYLCVTYTEARAICTMVAAGVHFFATAAFAWLLSYSLFLGNELSGEVEASLQIAHYTFIGWAIPFVVVLITFIWRYDSYVDDNYCWISQSKFNLKYAYIIPISIIIVMTVCVLVYDIVVFLKKKNPKKKIALKVSRSGLRSCCVLLPVMAAVWILADAVVLDSTIWLQGVLSVLNTILGVLVFVIMFYFNEEVIQKRKHAAKNKTKKLKISRTPQPSPETGGRMNMGTNVVLSGYTNTGTIQEDEIRPQHSSGALVQRESSPEEGATGGNDDKQEMSPGDRSSRNSMMLARQEFFLGATPGDSNEQEEEHTI